MPTKRTGRAGTPRADAARQAKRANGIAIALVALLTLGIGVGIVAGITCMLSFHGSGPMQVSPDRGSVADKDAPEEPTPPSEPPADDARSADLALDPNRQTDWLDHSNGEKVLYLTFDDGPSENTEKILDILDQYDAKATFFVTGHEPEYRPMIAEAYRRGNTIGMHTFTHDYATIYQSEDAFFSDLDQVCDVVKEQIGYVPYLTRFPGGASNTVSASYCPGIMTALSQDVRARGFQYYDWNVSSNDAAGNKVPVEKIVEASCSNGNYTNVILLCHDSAPKSTTVEALPQIIEYYQSQGFVCKALDRTSVVVHHGINN